MTGLAQDDIARMRDQLFFDGHERNRRLSRFWLLLALAAVIASAGVVSDSTATNAQVAARVTLIPASYKPLSG